MKEIQLHDKKFRSFISSEDILRSVNALGERMNRDLGDKNPLFISVLNGAFMFTSDLMKQIDGNCEITFVKMSSYLGTESSGSVKTVIGLDVDIKDRTVVVLEDIIDTGITISNLVGQLEKMLPKEIKIATLVFKPDAIERKIKIDYIGIEVPNSFIVGYGLDYDGLGRNLKDIYTLVL